MRAFGQGIDDAARRKGGGEQRMGRSHQRTERGAGADDHPAGAHPGEPGQGLSAGIDGKSEGRRHQRINEPDMRFEEPGQSDERRDGQRVANRAR
jgi:hypothetical protein